jgi:Rrf2 family iron-sulfur cluster assembly transcriptional regulator
MKLSNKGRYAVQAAFDLAYHGGGKAVQIRDLCERQGIPARFLEQVFQDLKKAGVVSSRRGPRGGYQLARPAEEVSVGEVIRAVEGPLAMAGEPNGPDELPGLALTRDVLGQLSRRLEAGLDEMTLAQMCAEAQARGLHRGAATGYVYAI